MSTDPLLIDVPETIITDRLLLRVPQAGDGALVYDTVRRSLPELKRWMPWASDDYSTEFAEQWCRRSAAKFLSREVLGYLIFTRGGDHLGNLSAFAMDWKVPKGEIGYWLRTDQCGQGYMTEAVHLLTDMLLAQLHFARAEIRADDRNLRSAAVAERCGYLLDGTLRQDSRDTDGSLRNTRIYSKIGRQ